MNTEPKQLYDCYLIDLDGTLYWGDIPIPHAVENINALTERVIYTTNNASRSPERVAQKLVGMGFNANAEAVLTSAQLGVHLLQEKVPSNAEVLVIGAQYLHHLVTNAGYQVVTEETPNTMAVIQGHSTETGWRQLSAAARAIRSGALYIATNKDLSLPSEKGLNVGNGAMVGAVELSTGATALAAGKPAPRAFEQVARKINASYPLVIGDRLDTDIQGGVAAGYHTWCVLTGVTNVVDICNAPAEQRPTYISKDLTDFAAKIKSQDFTQLDHISRRDITKQLDITAGTNGEVTVHFKTEALSVDDEICLFVAWAWQNGVHVATIKGFDNGDQNRIQQWRYCAEK